MAHGTGSRLRARRACVRVRAHLFVRGLGLWVGHISAACLRQRDGGHRRRLRHARRRLCRRHILLRGRREQRQRLPFRGCCGLGGRGVSGLLLAGQQGAGQHGNLLLRGLLQGHLQRLLHLVQLVGGQLVASLLVVLLLVVHGCGGGGLLGDDGARACGSGISAAPPLPARTAAA